MSSQSDLILDAYQQLSSLYKNPTRNGNRRIDGVAAPNVNDELMRRYQDLLKLFGSHKELLKKDDPALYYKVLGLLCETESYFGVNSPNRQLLVDECKTLIRQFPDKRNWEGNRPLERHNFTDPATRSEFKAKIRCCVGAIEIRRREDDLDELAEELAILEEFIEKKLDKPELATDSAAKDDVVTAPPAAQKAWTTLAFVLSAQARLFRQAEEYELSQKKLLDEVRCLNERASEIIGRFSDPTQLEKLTDKDVERLKDDLVFIRRRQTLSSVFNVGLAAFQRGFLKSANQACQAARLQFSLHGQFFHKVFNDLIILSIKRARTPRGKQQDFEDLKAELERDILPYLDPESRIGNPKLHFYALRELAVLQYYCEKHGDMLDTLDQMDHLMQEQKLDRNQWRSRVSNQRARVCWRSWVREQDSPEPVKALEHAHHAFTFASGLTQPISAYRDERALRAAIARSKKMSVIDTIESLVTYGSIQASAEQFEEAIKSANAVIKLSEENNPRLCAMGYLVRAEAFTGNEQLVEARQDIEKATELEKRIDHRYVADRRWFVQQRIENRLPLEFFFRGLEAEDFKKGVNRLLGWFIETYSKKKNRNEVRKALGVTRDRLIKYGEYLKNNEHEPYQHLIDVLGKDGDASEDKRNEKE